MGETATGSTLSLNESSTNTTDGIVIVGIAIYFGRNVVYVGARIGTHCVSAQMVLYHEPSSALATLRIPKICDAARVTSIL